MGLPPLKRYSQIDRILSLTGVSGLIALIISGAIAGRYFFHGPEEVPQILGYALSTIIGFYFGTGISAVGNDSVSNSN